MTRNQRSIVTNYFSRMSARIFEYLFSGSDEQTKGWRRPKGSGQEKVQGSQQVQGEAEVCQLICSHVLESYHFSAGLGPGPGPGTDAVGPTLATETARGGVTGTRRGDGTGLRRENIDIHRIEVLQLSVLALHTTCFVLK